MTGTALAVLSGKNTPAHVLARRQQRKADYSGIIGSGASTNRISLKGNRFQLKVGGETLYTHDQNHLDVAIVSTMPKVGRQWYATGWEDDGEKAPPACFSQDGNKPDPHSPLPQATTCKSCPKNQAGSGQGGKGKACSFIMRMVVRPVGDDSERNFVVDAKGGTIFGDQDEQDAKFNLKSYLAALQIQDYETTELYTRMSFDVESGVPKLHFTPIQVIDDPAESERLHDAAQTPEVKAMLRVGGNQVLSEDAAESEAPQVSATTQRLLPKRDVAPQQPVEEAEVIPVDVGEDAVQVADPEPPAPTVQRITLGKGAPKEKTAPKTGTVRSAAVTRPALVEETVVVEDNPAPPPVAAKPAVTRVNLTGKPTETAAPVKRTAAAPPKAQEQASAPATPKATPTKPKAQAASAAPASDIDISAIDAGLGALIGDWDQSE